MNYLLFIGLSLIHIWITIRLVPNGNFRHIVDTFDYISIILWGSADYFVVYVVLTTKEYFKKKEMA